MRQTRPFWGNRMPGCARGRSLETNSSLAFNMKVKVYISFCVYFCVFTENRTHGFGSIEFNEQSVTALTCFDSVTWLWSILQSAVLCNAAVFECCPLNSLIKNFLHICSNFKAFPMKQHYDEVHKSCSALQVFDARTCQLHKPSKSSSGKEIELRVNLYRKAVACCQSLLGFC